MRENGNVIEMQRVEQTLQRMMPAREDITDEAAVHSRPSWLWTKALVVEPMAVVKTYQEVQWSDTENQSAART